jgi:alpha-N-arabinofuranosidase
MVTRRSFLRALSAVPGFVRSGGLVSGAVTAREYHVSMRGGDKGDGTVARPFKTITAAAAHAFPGDVITVHEGIYRERVSPPRGGTADDNRIVYRAAPGERVEVTGAEVVKGWTRLQGDVWRVTLPNSFFGEFNPYSDVLHGDWFNPKGRMHHTGAVYLNGDWLTEAGSLDELLQAKDGTPLWFGRVDDERTTIWAQFRGVDPNQEVIEVNARQTVFYPEKTGIDFITVRGFILRRAATPWAPPTAEQKGVIGTHWSKGWIIEDCDVSYSICCGIALGKSGDQWDNTSANTAEGYVKTIERAAQNGWSKQNIGHHIVRRNTVSHCEQTGIVGSLGPVFSVVTGNTIHDIQVRQWFTGAEIAGIKFHAAIDVEISHNHIHRSIRGIWLDWMAQGTRVSGNLFHDNLGEDLFVEVDHGPFVVDNNLFLSKSSLFVVSQGGAFAHNLFLGSAYVRPFDGRQTPFMLAHSTQVAGYHDNPNGDMRFLNNIFAEAGDLSGFNQTHLPMHLGGNVFLGKAKPSSQEEDALIKPEFDPDVRLTEKDDGSHLEITLDAEWVHRREPKLVTSEELGLAAIPNLPYENADGTPIRLDRDFSGRPRNLRSPFPGPFERPEGGRQAVKIS